MTILDIYKNTKKELEDISPSMCFAKWKQTSLYLHVGHNSSCHLPPSHPIPLEELKDNPSALHNTSHKKKQQAMMLQGKRPEECGYCWSIEDHAPDVYSDRVTKSSENWSNPYKNEILKARTNDVNPSYLEVSFSNVCNLKCGYCNPVTSSKHMEEIKQFGPYPTSGRYNAIKSYNKVYLEREHNPYVEAFWKWWPDLYKDLKVFRITGGEPLLSKHTFRVLDWIIENPHRDLELNINSNLCVPDSAIDLLIEKVSFILKNKLVKRFQIYTSCEAYGKKAEYIRFGLDYNKWVSNCNKILTSLPDVHLTVMASYNVLCVSSFLEFAKEVKALKAKYSRVSIDIPCVRSPEFLSIYILTDDLIETIKEQVSYFEDNFDLYETNRMKKVYTVAKNTNIKDKDLYRSDFCKFVDEHDRRRGTDFFETFPELEQFYYTCMRSPS